MLECQGKCVKTNSCKGTVRRVRVTNQERTVDWGFKNYCQAAIFADRDEGLLVEVQRESIKASDFLKGKF